MTTRRSAARLRQRATRTRSHFRCVRQPRFLIQTPPHSPPCASGCNALATPVRRGSARNAAPLARRSRRAVLPVVAGRPPTGAGTGSARPSSPGCSRFSRDMRTEPRPTARNRASGGERLRGPQCAARGRTAGHGGGTPPAARGAHGRPGSHSRRGLATQPGLVQFALAGRATARAWSQRMMRTSALSRSLARSLVALSSLARCVRRGSSALFLRMAATAHFWSNVARREMDPVFFE
jgi:hypothetical protein